MQLDPGQVTYHAPARHSTTLMRLTSLCGCAVGLIFHFLSCPFFLLFWERTPWHHMRLFVTLHDAFMSIIDGEP
jgi:hypothetical protein